MNGVIKHWFDMEEQAPHSALDHEFIQAHTTGIKDVKQHVTQLKWSDLEASSGLSKERMKEFAVLLANANSGCLFGVWVSLSIALQLIIYLKSQTLPCYADLLAENIVALCLFVVIAVSKAQAKWVPIHSYCPAVILMKRILKESRRYGDLIFQNGMATRLGNHLKKWLFQKNTRKS